MWPFVINLSQRGRPSKHTYFRRILPATGKEGFTLTELMIVVAIISILTTIALPKFQAYSIRAKRTEVDLTFRTMKGYFDAWEGDGRPFTSDWDDNEFRSRIALPATTRYSYGLVYDGPTHSPVMSAVFRTGDPTTRDELMAVPGLKTCICTDAITETIRQPAACGNMIADQIGKNFGYGIVRTQTLGIFAGTCFTGDVN
jgi:prepilin-type N-terminal cleavage/methylation domain-containing protein